MAEIFHVLYNIFSELNKHTRINEYVTKLKMWTNIFDNLCPMHIYTFKFKINIHLFVKQVFYIHLRV